MDWLDRAQVGQTQLDNYTLSLHYYVVLQPDTCTFVQKQLSPSLPCFREIAGASKFLEFAFHENEQFLDSSAFFEDNFIGFFVLSPHTIEEDILISFEKIEKHPVFLDDTLHIIFEHHFPEISPYYLGQSLPAEHLAHHVFFCPYCHPSHNVVV